MLSIMKQHRLFAQLTSINLLSGIGDRLFYTAMLTLAASLPQADLGIMIVTVSESLPILFSFLLGNLADRMPHKSQKLLRNALGRAAIYLVIGLLIRYDSTLKIIVMMAALNFLSDLLGNYSSALGAPFIKLLVPAKNMESAQSLVSLTSQLVAVAANFAGSFLLGIVMISSIAYINSAVFMVTAIGYALIQKKLADKETTITMASSHENILATTLKTITKIVKNRPVCHDIMQLALVNGFFGGLTPVFVMFLNQHPEQVIFSNAMTISLLSGLSTLFIIIGNILSPIKLRQFSNKQLMTFADSFICLTAVGFLMSNLLSILLAMSGLSLLIGMILPRFTANIISSYPPENLGGIMTTVNSLLVLAPPLTGLLFPAIALVNLKIVYLCFLGYGIGVMLIGKAR